MLPSMNRPLVEVQNFECDKKAQCRILMFDARFEVEREWKRAGKRVKRVRIHRYLTFYSLLAEEMKGHLLNVTYATYL